MHVTYSLISSTFTYRTDLTQHNSFSNGQIFFFLIGWKADKISFILTLCRFCKTQL